MQRTNQNRFQDFFETDSYTNLKNNLYSYQLRKNAVEKAVIKTRPQIALEIGSGISPVLTGLKRVVYSELSFLALKMMKAKSDTGWFVVADATKLPFRSGVFSNVICSEVLEHVEADGMAVKEMARVIKFDGHVTLTIPHRKAYFAADDRFVNHHRRYERHEVRALLVNNGFRTLRISKVLGPAEKAAMLVAVKLFTLLKLEEPDDRRVQNRNSQLLMNWICAIFTWLNRLAAVIVWLDARIFPMSMATGLMVEATLAKEKSMQDGV
jgi:SAM-dependent methyltransferase